MNKYFFFILLFLPFQLFAQETDTLIVAEEPHYDIIQELQTDSIHSGQVRISSDRHINDLLQWQVHLNEKKKTFSGYRIQIYSVNSLGCNIEQLKKMRDEFEKTFQDIPAYLKYFDPDFKIRVGNYRNRLECIPDLHRIRKIYPASYAVKTEITLDDLKRVPMQDIPEEEKTEALIN